MDLFDANHLRLCTETAGSGQNLLFIGGTGWDLRKTRAPLNPPLTDHFHVALYDQRGQGRSDKPPGPYTMLDYARDAVALLDVLGWDRAHVIGYSFGGMVAQELAIGWPDRVRGLVLAATSAGGAGGASYPIHRFVDLPPHIRARRELEAADLRFTPEWQVANPEAARARIETRAASKAMYMDEPRAHDGLTAQLAARAAHDTFDRLGAIRAPTLLAGGTDDGQAPLDRLAAMQGAIAGARLIDFPGAHDFLGDSDAFFTKAIGFLQGIDA